MIIDIFRRFMPKTFVKKNERFENEVLSEGRTITYDECIVNKYVVKYDCPSGRRHLYSVFVKRENAVYYFITAACVTNKRFDEIVAAISEEAIKITTPLRNSCLMPRHELNKEETVLSAIFSEFERIETLLVELKKFTTGHSEQEEIINNVIANNIINAKNISLANAALHTMNNFIVKYALRTEEERTYTFEEVLAEMAKNHEKKNADYGNAFEENIEEIGEIAAASQLLQKVKRLANIISNPKDVNFEGRNDNAKDLAGYALMYYHYLLNNNV